MFEGKKNNSLLNTDMILKMSGHFYFLILLLFSIYFYKERILFTDSAFQFFKIINFEKINIEASRYGAILPQLPVLLLSKWGLDIKLLTITFSASFILLYYTIYIIAVHKLKSIEAGFAILLVLTVCISQSFFHPVTETHQSLVFSVLLYAILQFNNFRFALLQYFLAVFVIVLSFLTHPVALYTNVFVIGYVAIDKKQLKSFFPYTLLLMIGVLAVIKVTLTEGDSYEGRFFTELFHSVSTISNLPGTQSVKFFITRAGSLYFSIIILNIIVLAYFIHQKKNLKLLWTLGVQFVFLLTTIITYNEGDATLMMERAFMPLALFSGILFMQEIKPDLRKIKFIKIVFLVLLVFIGLNRIYHQGQVFKARTTFTQTLLKKTAQYDNRKYIFDKSELDQHMLAFWSNSFETLILSAIDVNVPTQTIFLSNMPEQLKKYTTESGGQVFLGTDFWLEWNVESLNPKYFNLPNDKPYRVVSLKELGIDSN